MLFCGWAVCWDALARMSWKQFCSSQITQRQSCCAQDTHPHIAARTFREVLNIVSILFIYISNSVLLLAWWIVSVTFAEEEREVAECSLRKWFPRASRASCARRFLSHKVCSARGTVGNIADSSLQVQAVAWSFLKMRSAKLSPTYTNSLSLNS